MRWAKILTLVAVLLPTGVFAQGTSQVTGRVTSSEGEPLAGARVEVVGTPTGAVTTADGRYRLTTVPGSHTLRASLLGHAPSQQTVTTTAGGTTTADFRLSAQALLLDEVVAVGYGTQSRRNVTGAVASVTAEELEAAPVTTLEQGLQGRVAGVQVVTGSGQPGAVSSVRIRGGNSISAGNDPLYVIDGVPVSNNLGESTTGTLMSQAMRGLNPLAAMNPDDIESVEVLKDASATSIYGARGANGVILITTKRGRAGANTVTFGSYYGMSEVRRTLPVLNAREFAGLVNTAAVNAGQPRRYTDAEISALGAGTDWQDEIFRRAPVRNVELAFSGGSEATQYHISGSLLQNDGVVIGTNMDRGTFRLNLDQRISSRLRIGNRLTFSRSVGNVLPNGGAGQEVPSVVLNAIMAPPTLAPYTETGEFFTGTNALSGRMFANPVASALLITNEEKQNRAIGNVFGELDLVPGLVFRTTLGLDYLNSTQNFFSPSNTYPGVNNNGYGSRGQAQTTSWQNENTLRYNTALGAHELDLLGGMSLQRINAEWVSGTGQNFSTDALAENGLNTAGTFVGVWTGAPHSSLLSYFSRANLNLSDRYLVTLTGRVDGSSKFGEGNQYAFFPSAALAWRASQEDFIRNLGLFDDLKLRVSYGRTGNQDIGNYASLATLGSTVYAFGGSRGIGFVPSTLANPDLKWETTDQLNAGIDAGFLDNRVSVTADYYDKRTHDLLLYVPIPATSGFGTSLQNVGEVRNHGFELGLRTVNLTGPLGWESSLNLSFNRNKVARLGVENEILAPVGVGSGANQNPTILRVGEPTNSFFGFRYAGMENGQPVYADLNGDGQVNNSDRELLGNAQPDYIGGFNNRLTYGPLDLSVFIQWSVGNEIYNINRALLTSAAGNANQLKDVLEGGEGIPTPRIGNTFDSRPSDLFIEDGSYVRGKNIRLGYTLPYSVLRRGGLGNVDHLQVYVSAQNFFTVTDYSGFDPEITEYAGSNLAQGFDFGSYPQPRQLTIGFSATY
ncbi:SusC/RagA family TonB-linked outer membrane protein [Longimicrobium terrae]|uniref:TonB-linked SusC/RagA family outer membrane protein n=1 Tax=Longimicrobium terrae TaxID=1639882 RepID=A0A841H7H7_9BACT|nr:TonB-dependent receptor [Longimicrobium terrae]MBB4639521.1 TonB-linked SusC/RagA family outer membrane protein [Longimicrobium terrae]MBB6073893.1 TonB-linked SusC/RagA family outer membrane protein [Longimicrobium terrae]NNC32489.1 TonB-dependent receptor [Longimicrobium terrae]